jgi:two-component system cell cycle sensor histidine kinase PleC
MDGTQTMASDYEERINLFVDICHDLKTPLNVIMGAARLIELSGNRCGQSAQISKNVKVIEKNCVRLLRLLNNIIDLARVDFAGIEFSPVNCDIVALLREITYSVSPFAEVKGIYLEYTSTSAEIQAEVDIVIIERILLNLLSNAIKYTAKGGKVTVKVCKCNDNTVKFSVMDTGNGIPEEMKEMIFERFTRSPSNPTGHYCNSSGIGLSLVKSLVSLHGGSIDLESKVNAGTEFTVTLPVFAVKNGKRPPGLSDRVAEQASTDLSSFKNPYKPSLPSE